MDFNFDLIGYVWSIFECKYKDYIREIASIFFKKNTII